MAGRAESGQLKGVYRQRLGWMSADATIDVWRLGDVGLAPIESMVFLHNQWWRLPSSAEAELYSTAEGASRGLGLQSMLQEMGVQASLAVSTDSSSAKSFASTRGLGRMRHLEVKDLWLQALVKDGRVTLRKIPGSYNVSDVLTKYSDVACCTRLLGLAGIRVVPVEDSDRAERGC